MHLRKTFYLTLFSAFLLFQNAFGQNNITGDWHGSLDFQGMMTLRIVFHVTESDGIYTTTLDSPDQGAYGIPAGTTTYVAPDFTLELPALKADFKGTTNADFTELTGTFTQAGMALPLVMGREKKEAVVPNRPQEPQPPFPYHSEDVVFENREAGVKLAGTLTLPNKEGKFPVVILVSGSGPQDRNEELLGHKPFLVLADHLTRKGIGVLRYDDRGVGASTGNHNLATSEDFATDALAAVAYLKTRPEVRQDKIGMVGHSEGGLIAPICASRSKNVAFIVLLAGTGTDGREVILTQTKLISRANGVAEDKIMADVSTYAIALAFVKTESDTAVLRQKLNAYFDQYFDGLSEEEKAEVGEKEAARKQLIEPMLAPWFRFFVRFDPKTALSKVKCPVLAINGEKDLQVEPKANLAGIESALKAGNNKNVTVKELPGLNHLFQTCETGAPSEYNEIEETFAPEALNVVSDWILGQLK